MASKVYEIAFTLAGQMSGNFAKTFQTASKSIQSFSGQINEANKQAANVDQVLKLRKETALASQSFNSASQKLTEMGRELAQAKQKLGPLNEKFKASSRETATLQQAFDATSAKTQQLKKDFLQAKKESQKLETRFKNAKNPSDALAQSFESARIKTQMLERAFNESENELSELGSKLEASKATTNQFGNELKTAEGKVNALSQEFDKERNSVNKAEQSLLEKRVALQKLEQATGAAGKSVQELKNRQNELAASADKARIAQEKMAKATELQGKFKNMASSSGAALGKMAAGAATLTIPVKAAMDFEDMQAELGKYSDNASEIFSGIKDLTKKYSKSAEDMTAMATNAMQAGIAKTKEDVLTLVESQTQAAVAFGMTGDAVGSAWADIQSKMGMSVKETQGLFDIVNKLGNETSASSEDVLEVLQRQGGTLKGLTALSSEQIAAMAGAFRSASTSSEVAATSMGTFVSRLTVGSSATSAQEKAFSKLGLNAKKLAKDMTGSSETAQAAIQDVFARINNLSKDQQGAVIGQLFGNEAGIKSAVATLAANSAMLGDNLKMVGDSANYSGSMFQEYMARANTTSEALGIAKNQISLITAEFGQALLPTVKKAAQSFIEIAGKVATFVSENQSLVLNVLKVTGAIAGMVAAYHAAKIAIGLTAQPILDVYKGYQAFQRTLALANSAMLTGNKLTLAQRAALLAQSVATKIAAAGQWVLNSAFWACPITWIVAGIAAVVAAAVLLYKNWDTVKAKCSELWALMKSAFGSIGNFIASVFNKIKAKCLELWATFQEKFPMLARIVQLASLPIRIAIQVVINVFKLLKAAGIALWNGIKWCWDAIKSATVAAWNAIQKPLINAWNKFKEFGAYIWGTFKSAFISAWTAIRNKIASIFDGLVGIVKGPMNAVIRLVNKAIGKINGISVKIPDWAGGGTLGFNIPKIPELAKGGIATGPTLAMIGEGRESEAVLPLSKLDAMLDGQSSRGGDMTVHFAPVININGGGGDVASQVQRGLDEGLKNLKRDLERLMANQRRLAY